jgi:hypothetical protein
MPNFSTFHSALISAFYSALISAFYSALYSPYNIVSSKQAS